MSVSLQSISANKHRLGRLGRAGAQEVVAAVGKLVPVDLAGHELPVAITNGRIGGGRVVGGHYDRDRRGQFLRGRAVQGVREIAVRGHAVVPVGGADLPGALRVQLDELGVAAVRAQRRAVPAFPPPGSSVTLARRLAASPGSCAPRNTRRTSTPCSASFTAVASANAVPEE